MFNDPVTTPLTTIAIGNPGVGKSTFLNSLIGVPGAFESGVSFGGGLTKVLKWYTDPKGNKFVDTPGLSDVDIAQQAAEEIHKALESGGLFKVFFIVTLESGRVRPDDKATINLVLQAVENIGTNYSIVINKLQPKVLAKLVNEEESRQKLATQLHIGLPKTKSIFYIPFQSELDAENNKAAQLDKDFLLFVEKAPTVDIDVVSAIAYQNLKKEIEEMKEELKRLQNDKDYWKKRCEEESQVHASKESNESKESKDSKGSCTLL